MDILFFLTGCLGLAETIDLFCGKDFLIFISDSIDPKKYNLKKVYAVEKWLFAIDTLSLFGMAFHLGGGTGDLVLCRRCQDPGSFRLHQPGHPPRALLPAGAHPGWLPLLLCEHAARMADRLLRSCDALPEWKMEGVSDCKRVKKRDGRIHFGGVISSIKPTDIFLVQNFSAVLSDST